MIRLLAIALAVAPALAGAAPDPDIRAVPTYESAGLYWQSPGGKAGCRVRFRAAGQEAWREGLDLWFDARNDECRGSLVLLKPGQRYQAELGLPGRGFTQRVEFTTWPDRFPVARTVSVPSGSETLQVTEGGSAAGYVVYDGKGATLDARNGHDFNIHIRASHVIVRGFKLRGASRDAIRLGQGVTDVVIEDNDISGWGREREGGGALDRESAIRAVCNMCPEVSRVTIQRNHIHSPRYGANSWSDGHPQGAQAITFDNCGGNHVIRGNDMRAGERRFNDVVGGDENISMRGFPNADSDIYDNVVGDAWDDGIEAEGGNRNVRIWSNHIDNTAIGIATTVTSLGPIYIFRNTYDRSRFYAKKSPDEDQRQPFFKAGSNRELGDGRRYLFHNSMLQGRDPAVKRTLGAGLALSGTGDDQRVKNTWSMNNLYRIWRDDAGDMGQLGGDNVFDSDLHLGPEPFDRDRARDKGRRIPNFNDGFLGKGPDIGAEEMK